MQQKSGSSLNGFLLGLVVGVVVTLMFTTKKGRQIFRAMTEEGLSKFSEVEDILHSMEEESAYDDVDELNVGELANEEVVPPVKEPEKKTEKTVSPPFKNVSVSGHRFFRKPGMKGKI